MRKSQKILIKIISGNSDRNISFADLIHLLEDLEFKCRIKGSHHIFFKQDVEEIINIQPDGKMAKAYQVKQIRNLIIKYKFSNFLQ